VEEVMREYGVELLREPRHEVYDAIVLAVGHAEYGIKRTLDFRSLLRNKAGIVFDLKRIYQEVQNSPGINYWSL
jgi:UDP-N-acetyl-D-mannosaminuronate dehydrogenase